MNFKNTLLATILGLGLGWLGSTYVASSEDEAVNKRGEIKTIIKSVYQYTEKFGKHEPVLNEQVHLGYDAQGNLIKEIHYNTVGGLINRYQCQYNEQDQLISKVLYQPDGSITEQWAYQYDPVSNTLTTVLYTKKEPLGSFTHRLVYSSAVRAKRVTADYSLQYSAEAELPHYKYSGDRIEESEYNEDELIRKMIYLNNEQGKPIEVSWYNPDNKLYRQWFYKYDEQGNRIEERCCHGDGACFEQKRWELTYNDQGRLSKSIEYQPVNKFGESYDEPVSQVIYEYEFY